MTKRGFRARAGWPWRFLEAGRGGRRDRGSASVWCVCAIAGLCVVFGAVLAAGQAVIARHRAAAAADLAALAAADRWTDGGEAACGTADRVARAQGGRLVRCVVLGEISDVTATAGRGPFTAEVRARGGPPDTAVGPVAPVGPADSLGPSAPVGPVASLGPSAPVGPAAPVGSAVVGVRRQAEEAAP
ncbi:helicase/secretion neighborhood TadE-like protein [Actinobacteria bacterium OK074]|nr:helicase/secretion neighborhood TadE-like protein [Actinobacteria bacterium OK074]